MRIILPRTALFLTLLLLLAAADAAEMPQADVASFNAKVAPLLKSYCVDCHSGGSPEGKFSIEEVDPDLLAGGDLEAWRLIDEQIRFGDMPPEDADQLSAGERSTVLTWIRGEMLKTQRPGVVTDEKLLLPKFGNYVDHQFLFKRRLPYTVPAPPRVWRLRPQIYESIAPQLAERVGGLSDALSAHDGPEFKDYAAPYFLDEASTQQLFANAKRIAEAQLAESSRDRVFKELVSDKGPPPAKVVGDAIETAFRKALGRGPTADEKQRYQQLYYKSVEIGGYQSAARALLTGVLMQPEFMFRQELGDSQPDAHGRVRLTQAETAYALSYALDNRPVEWFVNAAQQGELATNEQVAALVRAQLKDESLQYEKNPRIIQFFREYFNYPFAGEVFKDQPEGGEHEPELLVADLEFTIKDVLKHDRDVLAELLTTREYYVNAGYGRKDTADQIVKRDDRTRKYQTAFSLPLDWKWAVHLQPVKFAEDERAGVLTHPAWLAAWSGNFENHPVQRGKWVREKLLGGSVPDVPIGVDARVPEAEHTTFRDRLKLATSASECWRCHRKMDPLGLPFERYDHYGRFQRLDAGQPVDVSGEISRVEAADLNQAVASPTEMVEALARSEHVEQVFLRHVFRFFMGRNETLGDANTLQDMHQAYRESDGSFNAAVATLLSSDSFLLRQVSNN